MRDELFVTIDDAVKSQLRRIQNKATSTKASMLYLTILNETKTMVLQSETFSSRSVRSWRIRNTSNDLMGNKSVGAQPGGRKQKQRGTGPFVPFFVGFRQLPRPGQSRERRPDNRHPSHSIEDADSKHERIRRPPRAASPPFLPVLPAAPTTGRPARHIQYNRDGMKIHPRQASPTTAKREAVSSDRHPPYHHRHRFSPARSSSCTRISFSLSTPTPKRLCHSEPYRFNLAQPPAVVHPPDRQDSGFCTTNSYINGV